MEFKNIIVPLGIGVMLLIIGLYLYQQNTNKKTKQIQKNTTNNDLLEHVKHEISNFEKKVLAFYLGIKVIGCNVKTKEEIQSKYYPEKPIITLPHLYLYDDNKMKNHRLEDLILVVNKIIFKEKEEEYLNDLRTITTKIEENTYETKEKEAEEIVLKYNA